MTIYDTIYTSSERLQIAVLQPEVEIPQKTVTKSSRMPPIIWVIVLFTPRAYRAEPQKL
jgi:hypothetical protein